MNINFSKSGLPWIIYLLQRNMKYEINIFNYFLFLHFISGLLQNKVKLFYQKKFIFLIFSVFWSIETESVNPMVLRMFPCWEIVEGLFYREVKLNIWWLLYTVQLSAFIIIIINKIIVMIDSSTQLFFITYFHQSYWKLAKLDKVW